MTLFTLSSSCYNPKVPTLWLNVLNTSAAKTPCSVIVESELDKFLGQLWSDTLEQLANNVLTPCVERCIQHDELGETVHRNEDAHAHPISPRLGGSLIVSSNLRPSPSPPNLSKLGASFPGRLVHEIKTDAASALLAGTSKAHNVQEIISFDTFRSPNLRSVRWRTRTGNSPHLASLSP